MLSYRDFHSFSCNQKITSPVAVYTHRYVTEQEICPVSKEGDFSLRPLRKDPAGGYYLATIPCGPPITPTQATTLFKEGELQIGDGHLKICGELTALRVLSTQEVLKYLDKFDLIKKVEDFLTEEVFDEDLTPQRVFQYLNFCHPVEICNVLEALLEAHESLEDTVSAQRNVLRDYAIPSRHPTNIPLAGHLFIIPNPAEPLSEFWRPEHVIEDVEAAGFTIEGDHEVMVEVWATSDQSSNWSCHSFKDHPERTGWTRNLPYGVLKDKKEGDLLKVVDPTGSTVYLRCVQEDFRYWHVGNFQQALAKVTRHLPSCLLR